MSNQEAPRTTGVVKWWNDAKGYGFLIEDSNDRDIFIHWTGIWYDKTITPRPHLKLEEGQRVAFEVRQEDRGLQAYEIVVLD
jgi:cold shock protein